MGISLSFVLLQILGGVFEAKHLLKICSWHAFSLLYCYAMASMARFHGRRQEKWFLERQLEPSGSDSVLGENDTREWPSSYERDPPCMAMVVVVWHGHRSVAVYVRAAFSILFGSKLPTLLETALRFEITKGEAYREQ